jgi:hypothetical protein
MGPAGGTWPRDGAARIDAVGIRHSLPTGQMELEVGMERHATRIIGDPRACAALTDSVLLSDSKSAGSRLARKREALRSSSLLGITRAQGRALLALKAKAPTTRFIIVGAAAVGPSHRARASHQSSRADAYKRTLLKLGPNQATHRRSSRDAFTGRREAGAPPPSHGVVTRP